MAPSSNQVLADDPPDIEWETEKPLPFEPTGQIFFSPILTEGGSRVVYIIDQGTNFYKYNLLQKQWAKKASPNYSGMANEHFTRTLALSPDGTTLACISEGQWYGGGSDPHRRNGGGRRIELYDISTDTWSASKQIDFLMSGSYPSYAKALVWEDDNDTLWVWCMCGYATVFQFNVNIWGGLCAKYSISGDNWTRYANGTFFLYRHKTPPYEWYGNPCSAAIKADNSVVYLGAADTDYEVTKYDVATDSYSTFWLGFVYNRFCRAYSRTRLWYYEAAGTCQQGYIDTAADGYNDDQFPENTQRTLGYGKYCGISDDLNFIIAHAKSESPRLMSWSSIGARFDWFPEYPEPGDNVTFSASSSYAPGQIVSYEWHFGDGYTVWTTSENITHIYAGSDDYDVTLTIVDSGGLTNTTTKTISVRNWYLLETYAPVLYLHEVECYFPNEITSMLDQSDLRNGEVITGSVTIGDLADHNTSDYYLDMWNAGPGEPAPAVMFADYPFNIYAREYTSDPAFYVLQYWYFFPYNDWFNDHEGDWEMVTVFVSKSTGEPQTLTCAYHTSRSNHDWQEVALIDGTHPKVFIAWGSHSSWATPGTHYLEGLDWASANGTALYPTGVSPELITGVLNKAPYSMYKIVYADTWIEWRGKWGEKGIPFWSDGPQSPGQQGPKWDNPTEWANAPPPSEYAASTHSPVNLHAYDQYGNHVGLNESGEIEAEIPDTYLYYPSDEEEEVIIIDTEEDLRFEIEATAAGEFDFTIERYISAENKEIIATYEDVQITENTTAKLQISPDNLQYIMEVDLDGNGTVDEYKAPDSITGINDPPVADANGPYSGEEGSPVTLTASNSTDPNGDPLKYRWDFNSDGTWDTDWLTSANINHTWYDDYAGAVRVEVWDGELADNATAVVNVINVAPTISEIAAPLAPAHVGAGISTNATFSDPGTSDTHVAIWDWGDNNTSEGYIHEVARSVSGNHTYTAAGVYSIKLRVTDDDGASDESIFHSVVVYDPSAGFVTGGGWINSQTGAYPADPSLTRKANLGFVGRYQQGASTPTGQAEFLFKPAGLNFHSTNYEWLVITGAKAILKGEGTTNGEGSYKFQITVIDAEKDPNDSFSVDRFRIKIWKEVGGNEVVIYDNALGDDSDNTTTELGGGSIAIH